MHGQDRKSRVTSIYLQVIRLAQRPHLFDFDPGFPDVHSRWACSKWARKTKAEIEARLDQFELWSRHLLRAAVATWLTLDVRSPPNPQALYGWIRAGNRSSIEQFFATVRDMRRRQIHKLASFRHVLEEVGTDYWRKISQERARQRPTHNLAARMRNVLGSVNYRIYDARICYLVWESWCGWAESWPTVAWTADRRKSWARLVGDVCDLATIEPAVNRRWNGWLRSMQNAVQQQTCNLSPIDRLDRQTRQAATTLVVYRRACGAKGKWPKQIQAKICTRERFQKEVEFLESSRSERPLSPEAELRLGYLQQQIAPKLPRTKNLRERLVSTANQSSLQAAQSWLEDRRQELLRRLDVPRDVYQTKERAAELLKLLAHLPKPTRELLLSALRAADNKVTGYRLQGSRNLRWIDSAIAAGLKPDVWLDPNPQPLMAAKSAESFDRSLTMSLSSLASDVLWIGRPFDTCLDLRGGDYCESLVPNYMDANKQLLVIKDRQGRMVGRKLLAVVPEKGLVGYYLYLSTSKKDQGIYDAVELEVAGYCRNLANAAGLELRDEGTPKKIHTTGWYDDGPVEWPELQD